MKISVQLLFRGTCEEAFGTYARVLNGTIAYQLRYRDSPVSNQVPADFQDKLYHATMTIGDLTLLGGDPWPHRSENPEGFSLVLSPSTPADAQQIFDALAEGGTIQMPLQETFWSSSFGVLVDRFGVPWTINCEQTSAP